MQSYYNKIKTIISDIIVLLGENINKFEWTAVEDKELNTVYFQGAFGESEFSVYENKIEFHDYTTITFDESELVIDLYTNIKDYIKFSELSDVYGMLQEIVQTPLNTKSK